MILKNSNRKKSTLRDRLQQRQKRQKLNKSSKARQDNSSGLILPLELFKLLHNDLPRKIVICIVVFFIIYLTAQVNHTWTREASNFIYRVTTEQPNYGEIFSELVQDRGILEEYDIAPVIGEEEEPF